MADGIQYFTQQHLNMDLPNIEKGMRILAEDINRISREVRASAITSFVGGRFTRSQAGTSISVDPGYIWDSNGSSEHCPFKVTNATQGTTRQILIQQSTVNTPNARWPLGMGVGYPDFKLLITESSYIYVKLTYVENDVIVVPEDYGVMIAKETTLKQNTVNEEYILLAVVAFNGGQITTITNSCMNVTANPCNLKWS